MRSYINKFELIKAIMNGVPLDHAQLISMVDRKKVLNKIYKNEPELQDIGKFYITDNPMEEENWSKIPIKDKGKILRNIPTIYLERYHYLSITSIITNLLKFLVYWIISLK